MSIGSRSFSHLVNRTQISKSTFLSLLQQRRCLADEAAATRSEPAADGIEEAQNDDAEHSIASEPEPASPLSSIPADSAPETTGEAPPTTEAEAAAAAAEAPIATQSVETPGQAGEPSILEKAGDAVKAGAQAAADAVTGGTQRAPEPEDKKKIYVGNLFYDVRSDDLEKEFGKCGTITSAKVITDGRGLSKGYVTKPYFLLSLPPSATPTSTQVQRTLLLTLRYFLSYKDSAT